MALGDPLTTATGLWLGAVPVACAAAGLFASVLEAPPARHRSRPRVAAGLAVVAALAFTVSGALGALGLAFAAALAVTAALACCAGTVWLARGPAGGTGSGGGGPRRPADLPPPPGPDEGIDWEAFEHAFESYAASHGAAARLAV
jgi:hypothetical protein